MIHSGGTYLEGCHRNGVNITLFRGATEIMPRRPLQKTFWSHILKNSEFGVVDRDIIKCVSD